MVNFLDNLFWGRSLADRIGLESAEDEYTLTFKNGSLASFVQIGGAMCHENEFKLASVADALRVSLTPFLSRPEHALEIIFSRDPSAAQRHVEQIINRQRARATEIGLDMTDIFAGTNARLADNLIGETCIAVIHTRPTNQVANDSGIMVKSSPEERLLAGGCHFSRNNDMSVRHMTLTDALCRDLEMRGRQAIKCNIVDALREIRVFLYPFSAPWKQEWMPVLPLPLRKRTKQKSGLIEMPTKSSQMNGEDYSNLGMLSFDRQLAVEDAQIIDMRTVRIGDVIFSGFDVTVAPEILTSFDELVTETMASPLRLDWRCRFLIEPGGLQAVRLREQFARLFAFAAPIRNMRIRNSIAALREIDGIEDTVVRLRISFATWARVAHESDLRRKRAILQRAAEQWGNLSTDGVSADPLTTVLSSSASLGLESTAPPAAAPLSRALAMLPISRQASPWLEGPVTFRTSDGKIWPYWPGSSRQNSWVEIYSGTPGSGKSVAMHAINRSCILAPHAADSKASQLPLIAVIDIGRSSKGFIDLMRESLPVHRRQEVVHLKLRMLQEHAINPFDTPLGMRRPLTAGRSFMVNFLTTLCGVSDSGLRCPVAGIAGSALDQAFDTLADDKNPKRYIEGEEPVVDQALSDVDFCPDSNTSWWEVTDVLFAVGRIDAASQAQTRAVPVLTDLIAASYVEHVASLYAEARIGFEGELVMKSFHRQIIESVRDYRIIASPTRFNMGAARIAALDLEEVAGVQSGILALRQTALMYMLARQSMTNGWFVDESEINKMVSVGHCPLQYREFHIGRARANRSTPKLLCIDEFHRTGGLAGLHRQILQDIREGRKNNVRIALASQLPSDFGSDILDVASTIFIFAAPTEASSNILVERFGLSDAEQNILRHRLTGPRADGAPFFAVIRHKRGTVKQLLYLTLGANELWALSTTPEDTVLRDGLVDIIGPIEARKLLANRFSTGSAKAEIEVRAARRAEKGNDISHSSVIDIMINELVEEFKAGRVSIH